MGEQEMIAYKVIEDINENFAGYYGIIDLVPALIYLTNEEFGLRIPYGEAQGRTMDQINIIMNEYDEEERGIDKYEYRNRLINHKRLQEEGFEYSLMDVEGMEIAQETIEYLETYYNEDYKSMITELYGKVNIALGYVPTGSGMGTR